MRQWKWSAMFEPRDLWVGVFWDRRPDGLHIYLCAVPTLVAHGVRTHGTDAS